MAVTAIAYLIVYLFLYDKSYYHIDAVREPMIRFLFFESMLLGAFLRVNDERFRKKRHMAFHVVLCVFLFLSYFASKIAFSQIAGISSWQIVNQVVFFALLGEILNVFAFLDSRLVKMPDVVKRVIELIASMTLEIYVVQYAIIDKLRNIASFPLNWVALTASIALAAFVLHWICQFILDNGNKAIAAIRRG